MSIYDRLAALAHPAGLTSEPTSYFSTPEAELDPKLFTSRQTLRPNIRAGVLSLLYGFWHSRYTNAEAWSTVYIAGSGVSYQWSAARDPGDLDVLIEVDWVQFRRNNQDLRDLGDNELRQHLNHELQHELWPATSNWQGFETTFYINEGSMVGIHPYAAYNVTTDHWLVAPDPHAHPSEDVMWQALVQQDLSLAQEIIASYNKAFEEVEGTVNPGLRLNAEITLRTAAAKGALLFDHIHAGRKHAFGPTGQGYNDFDEYRYKTAKGNGIMSAFRDMKTELQDAGLMNDQDVYGLELPDAHDLLVQTAISRRYRG